MYEIYMIIFATVAIYPDHFFLTKYLFVTHVVDYHQGDSTDFAH